ncbi:MAG: sigma-70 family RNA polymerase sigma factor [Clostridiales bacterium]|nr:sigma-70 family RNA polymerase sigma factor [Clostridiales bacterium]
MRRTEEDRRVFLGRVRPLISGLFNAAHYITGSSEAAERVTREAVMAAYLRMGKLRGRVGFREAVLREIRGRALRVARRATAEVDLRPLSADADGPMLAFLAAQPPEQQRIAVLRYGCGLSGAEVARAMGLPRGQVQSELRRLMSRAERQTPPDGPRITAERMMAQELKRHMYREGGAAFDQAAMLRALEQDAEQIRLPRRVARRIVGATFTALAALLCAALFWLLAVLTEG